MVPCAILKTANDTAYSKIKNGKYKRKSSSVYKVQLSLTNLRDALHHGKRQNVKTVT